MPDSTFWSVVLGGAIAILGGIVGPTFLHFLQRNAEKQNKRAEKFEELLATLYAHHDWLERIRKIRVYGEDLEEAISPYPKLLAICTVYFPTLSDRMLSLGNATMEYELAIKVEKEKTASREI